MSPIKPINLTVMFIALAFIVVAGITGGIVLTIYDKDATAFYGFFTATLATVVAFVGLGRSQSKLSESQEEIKHKVNGNLSKLIDIATRKADSRADMREINEVKVSTGVTGTVEG